MPLSPTCRSAARALGCRRARSLASSLLEQAGKWANTTSEQAGYLVTTSPCRSASARDGDADAAQSKREGERRSWDGGGPGRGAADSEGRRRDASRRPGMARQHRACSFVLGAVQSPRSGNGFGFVACNCKPLNRSRDVMKRQASDQPSLAEPFAEIRCERRLSLCALLDLLICVTREHTRRGGGTGARLL